jgi:polyferredoxin
MTAGSAHKQPEARDPLAFLPRLDRHKPRCGPVAPSRASRWRALVLVAVHVLIGAHVVHWLLTGRTLTPVEPSEAMQTVEEGAINAGFVLFLALIGLTLVFGRFFCGWACHVVALQDLCAYWLGKLGVRPRPLRSRLLVLAPWAVAGHMFLWPHVEHWLGHRELPDPSTWRWQLQTEELWRTFPGPIMAVGTFLVVGFLIVWWLGAKGFCTHGCPYGAVFALADRVAPVRIVVSPSCDACGHCTAVCTSNVRVHEEVAKHGQIVDPGCMKCLDCVSVCPKDALSVGLALPKPFAVSQQRLAARADFTWPEEVALAIVAFATAQWGFRGAWFGEGVPFLMAVGLGAITAVFALLAWRLVRARDVAFQHRELKRHGALLPAGRFALLAIAGWLLFTAHTGWGKHLRDGALDAAREPVRASFYQTGPAAAGDLQRVLAGVEAARAWALGDEPLLREVGALLLRGLGRHVDAEKELLAIRGDALTLGLPEANLALAAYCMDPRRQRFDDARALVAQALRTQPDNGVAKLLQQRLDALPQATK